MILVYYFARSCDGGSGNDALIAMLGQIMSEATAIEKIGGKKGGSGGGDEDLPESVSAFDTYLKDKLDPFKEAASALGGDAAMADYWQMRGCS